MTKVTIRDKRRGRIEEFQGRFKVMNKNLVWTGDWETIYRFRVRAANGKIVAQSEGYRSKASRAKGIRALVAVCLAYGLGGN